jgi:hypothetical protein
MSDTSGDKYYKLEKNRQENFKKSEKNLDKKYQEALAKEREQDALNRLHPEDSTAEPEFKKGGKVGLWANINRRKKLGISRPKSKTTISKKAYANMKAGFPSRGQGRVKKIKITKSY